MEFKLQRTLLGLWPQLTSLAELLTKAALIPERRLVKSRVASEPAILPKAAQPVGVRACEEHASNDFRKTSTSFLF